MLESCKITVDGIAGNVETLDARVSALELNSGGDISQGAAIIEVISEIKTIADASNATLNSLKTSVDTNSTSITAVKTDVSAVKTVVAGVQNTANSTNNTVGTINNNVNTANTTLANLSNRIAALETAVANINNITSSIGLKSVTKTYTFTQAAPTVNSGLTQAQLNGLYTAHSVRVDNTGITLSSVYNCTATGDNTNIPIGTGLALIRSSNPSYPLGSLLCSSINSTTTYTYTITWYYFG